jgi:hypothetical protein
MANSKLITAIIVRQKNIADRIKQNKAGGARNSRIHILIKV